MPVACTESTNALREPPKNGETPNMFCTRQPALKRSPSTREGPIPTTRRAPFRARLLARRIQSLARREKRGHFPSALGPPRRPLGLLFALSLLRRQPLGLLHDADRFTAPTPARRHNEHSSHTQNTTPSQAKPFSRCLRYGSDTSSLLLLSLSPLLTDSSRCTFFVPIFSGSYNFLVLSGTSIEIPLEKSLMPFT